MCCVCTWENAALHFAHYTLSGNFGAKAKFGLATAGTVTGKEFCDSSVCATVFRAAYTTHLHAVYYYLYNTLGPQSIGFVLLREWKIAADSSSCLDVYFFVCSWDIDFCSLPRACVQIHARSSCMQVGKMKRNCRFDGKFFDSIWPKVNSLHGVMAIAHQRTCT